MKNLSGLDDGSNKNVGSESINISEEMQFTEVPPNGSDLLLSTCTKGKPGYNITIYYWGKDKSFRYRTLRRNVDDKVEESDYYPLTIKDGMRLNTYKDKEGVYRFSVSRVNYEALKKEGTNYKKISIDMTDVEATFDAKIGLEVDIRRGPQGMCFIGSTDAREIVDDKTVTNAAVVQFGIGVYVFYNGEDNSIDVWHHVIVEHEEPDTFNIFEQLKVLLWGRKLDKEYKMPS